MSDLSSATGACRFPGHCSADSAARRRLSHGSSRASGRWVAAVPRATCCDHCRIKQAAVRRPSGPAAAAAEEEEAAVAVRGGYRMNR